MDMDVGVVHGLAATMYEEGAMLGLYTDMGREVPAAGMAVDYLKDGDIVQVRRLPPPPTHTRRWR